MAAFAASFHSLIGLPALSSLPFGGNHDGFIPSLRPFVSTTCGSHCFCTGRTPSTFHPDAVWMETQARAFLDHVAAERLPCEIVTRDFDGKFSKAFNQVFKERSIRVKPVGPQAPNLNAFIERWIQSLKYEALNHFVVFGKEHFDYIVSEYVAYYHECRPHQGLGNVLLPQSRGEPGDAARDASGSKPCLLADVKCDARLGGLLKHFYRQAA